MSADDWGRGYDAGQSGIIKAVETAEKLATHRERERIIRLILAIRDNFRKPPIFNYRAELTHLVNLIDEGYGNDQ